MKMILNGTEVQSERIKESRKDRRNKIRKLKKMRKLINKMRKRANERNIVSED